MSDRDYYEILGLTPRADGAMVDQAYWHLARKYQVLATTNARGRKLLDDLNEAYGVLGNTRLRREYDAFRDDVLVRGGVIGAVPSDPAKAKPPRTAAGRGLPGGVGLLYVTAAALGIAAVGGGWYLGNLLLAFGGGTAAVLLMALPVAASRIKIQLSMPSLPSPSMPSVNLPSVNLPAAKLPSVSMPSVSMPSVSMPNVSMPEVRAPKLDLARVGERLGRTGERDEGIDADELRASTSAVIARWRKSMGLKPVSLREMAGGEPSTDLVEIVEAERHLDESESEPLMAVIDILKGAHRKAATPAGED